MSHQNLFLQNLLTVLNTQRRLWEKKLWENNSSYSKFQTRYRIAKSFGEIVTDLKEHYKLRSYKSVVTTVFHLLGIRKRNKMKINSTIFVYFYPAAYKNEQLLFLRKLLEDYPLLTVIFAFILGLYWFVNAFQANHQTNLCKTRINYTDIIGSTLN